MVVLHFKKNEANQFLCSINTAMSIDEIRLMLVTINNMRLKVDRLAVSLEDLALRGPMKPEELRGLDRLADYVKNEDITVINGLKKMPPQVGTREVKDETNYRSGFVLEENITRSMLDESMKAKKLIAITQVENKVQLSVELLQE